MTLPAVIGGSQAFRLLETDFSGSDLGPRKTPWGESEPLFRIEDERGEFLFLSRHGTDGYDVSAPFVNYRANVYALKDLGATHILSWSGPGAINADFEIGSFVLPDDLVDETRNRPQTFFEGKGLGFVRQNPVFCPSLRRAVKKGMEELGLSVREGGTYVVTEGPRLETPAEIRKYGAFGADLVGMTLAPEVFLARELEMHYAPLCYVTNYAEGVRERAFESGVLFEGLADLEEMKKVDLAVSMFGKIVRAALAEIGKTEYDCACERLLERYRKKKLIGQDFREYAR